MVSGTGPTRCDRFVSRPAGLGAPLLDPCALDGFTGGIFLSLERDGIFDSLANEEISLQPGSDLFERLHPQRNVALSMDSVCRDVNERRGELNVRSLQANLAQGVMLQGSPVR